MGGAADLVILGGSIEPIATPANSHDDAVAIRGGRIVAIGASDDLRALIGPGTEVVELQGETVLPGFQDAHIHPIEGGLLADRCDLHALTDAGAYLEAIRAYADGHPEREWITGSGWSLPAFPGGEPDRALLDQVVGGRPAFLESNDGHVAWASTRALELAGIDDATADPPDGRIARDASGAATGTLHEVPPLAWKTGAAVTVVMASRGYPETSSSGDVIVGCETLDVEDDVHVIHAGTARDEEGRLVTAGGRVLAVTAVGADLADARAKAYEGVVSISFPGAQWRRDIAAVAAGVAP